MISTPFAFPGARGAAALAIAATLTLTGGIPLDAQSRRGAATTPLSRTIRHFESIRHAPPELIAFLRAMPKGADLHSHLSGAVYAERYVEWAAAQGLCVTVATRSISPAPCDAPAEVAASDALRNGVLYRQLIDAWSMRAWQQSGQTGHDWFFDAFAKFGAATGGNTGAMLADVVARAAHGNVSYVELMLTPDAGFSSRLGREAGWDGDLAGTFERLQKAGIAGAREPAVTVLREAEAVKDRLLKCGTPTADPGCAVVIRYIAQVGRLGDPGQVFAQIITGLALASDPSTGVVGVNMVQPEDGLASMKNFGLHMQMFKFARARFPNAKVTLHAGELAPGLVPPDGLRSHVRESVVTAGAERIGHGVSVMHEDDPYGLLREMARRNVLVEICLSSNDVILGVRGADHPLRTYIKYGVPVTLATDDEGVARSDISREYFKAVREHGLGYRDIKRLARASVEHAFAAPADKARLLTSLDAAFAAFERRY
ncbi:MAG: adenosine deaminase [Acidobacteriota bacterium]|nr:adenosine deaminase [Acidobacteriota bacterium]